VDEAIPPVRRLSLASVGLLVALVVVLPLLAPGFTLVYDMVFVPRPHLSAALLGISPVYPRTVPTQLLVTLASKVVPGAVVQKTILLGIFALAVVGGGRLVGAGGRPAGRPPKGAGDRWSAFVGAAAAIGGGLVYAWNPMTFERLRLGQWALLLGAAVLPWAVHAALRYRWDEPNAAWVLTLWFGALVATGPYMATIGVATALAVALWPARAGPAGAGETALARPGGGPSQRRRAALLVAGAVAVNLVWLVPAVLHPSAPGRGATPASLFGARSDSPLGTVGSVLTLGGVWRSDLAPAGRSTIAWIPAAILIAAVAALGWRRMGVATPWADGARTGLLVAAAVGLALALAPGVPWAGRAMTWAIRTLPGGGVLRDSQKFAIPFALLVAVAFGLGIADLLGRVAGRTGAGALAIVLIALPVALAPTLAWGAGGTLATSSYPDSWAAVERVTARDPIPGGILILPWHAYVPFPWNRNRPVHQPAILFFSRPVLQSSALELGTVTLPAEDPWARAATPAVEGPEALAPALPALGVRYVLVFKVGDLRSLRSKTSGLRTVLDAPDLVLYRAPPPGPIPAYPEPPSGAVVAGDLVAVGWLVLAAVTAVRGSRRKATGHPAGAVIGLEGPERLG
jgi:hypothetical protein